MRRAAVALVGLLVLTGCGSVVTGSGSATRSGSASTSTSASTPVPSPSSTGPVTIRFPRKPVDTAIGDPPTADLCGAVGLAPFAGLGGGYTPSFNNVQYPPSCFITLRKSGAQSATVAVLGTAPGTERDVPGRTTRRQSGLTVYVLPFEPKPFGNCERAVVARGILLQIDVITHQGVGAAARSFACRAADAMTAPIAAAAAGHAVPRLPKADPSVSDLDFCAALRVTSRTGLGGIPDTAAVAPDTISTGCTLVNDRYSLYIEFKVNSAGVSKDATATSVGGHSIFARKENTASSCSFYSEQGITSDGRREAVYATIDSQVTPPSPAVCSDSALLLARFLTAAGLR